MNDAEDYIYRFLEPIAPAIEAEEDGLFAEDREEDLKISALNAD